MRNPAIDLIRFIGFTLIVLAHCGMPSNTALFQLRCFDVPLMLFASGLAFSGKSITSYWGFLAKRTLRLLVPVMLFVTIYMLVYQQILVPYCDFKPLKEGAVLGTYMLTLNPTIGFVWIIRIFLMVMLVTPLLSYVERKVPNNLIFILLLAILFVVQQVLATTINAKTGSFLGDYFVRDYVLYIVGYSAIFLLGLRMRKLDFKQSLPYLIFFVLVMAYMVFDAYEIKGLWNKYGKEDTWMLMQANKYPPRAYFLIYGALCGIILWMSRNWWLKVLNNKLFVFIGQNTIWIYLWHIPLAHYISMNKPDWPWAIVYVVLYGYSLAIFAAQYWLVRKINKKYPDNGITKYFVG